MSETTAAMVFQLLAQRYEDKPDDFALSIGHHAKPDVGSPLSIYNMPEFCAYLRITMAEVRRIDAALSVQAMEDRRA